MGSEMCIRDSLGLAQHGRVVANGCAIALYFAVATLRLRPATCQSLVVVRVRLHDGRTAPLVGVRPEIPAASAASGLAVARQAYPVRDPSLSRGSRRTLPGADRALTNASICGYPCIVRRWASIPIARRDRARRLRLLGSHGRRHLAVRDGRHARQAAVVAYRMGRGPEVAPGQRRGRHARIPCVSTSVRWPPRGVA